MIDLTPIHDAWPPEEGSETPDWDRIMEWVNQHPDENLAETTDAVTLHWFSRLIGQLGGGYLIHQSTNFYLLTTADAATADKLIRFAEQVVTQLRNEWTIIDAGYGFGRHALLLLEDLDDYDWLTAPYFAEGEHAASSGVLLSPGGFCFVAIPEMDSRTLPAIIAHELTHDCLSHLPLPLWLNEGLAQFVEYELGYNHRYELDTETAQEHRSYWSTETIDDFWSGWSFDIPGKPQELSYSLAIILTQIIIAELKGFPNFVKHAHCDDAGESAALEHLGVSLGDVVAVFLGDGYWAPSPPEEEN